MHNTMKKLRTDEAVSSHFMKLVRDHLANSDAEPGEITLELELLITLCTHHAAVLRRLAGESHDAETRQRKIWIMDLASTPVGNWLPLRARLASFIRLFSLPPRARGAWLFSPEGGEPAASNKPRQSITRAR
jgi:hypothetical protein